MQLMFPLPACRLPACLQVMAVLDAMPSSNLKPENDGEQPRRQGGRRAGSQDRQGQAGSPPEDAAHHASSPCQYFQPADSILKLPLRPPHKLLPAYLLPTPPPLACLPLPADVALEANKVYRTTYMFSATMPPAVERLAR